MVVAYVCRCKASWGASGRGFDLKFGDWLTMTLQMLVFSHGGGRITGSSQVQAHMDYLSHNILRYRGFCRDVPVERFQKGLEEWTMVPEIERFQ